SDVCSSDLVGLVSQHKAVGGLHLGDVVGTQRQRDGDLAGGAVVGNAQEIVGGGRAGRAEFDFIHLTIFAGGHGRNQVAIGVPECALAVAGGNVAVSADFVGGSGQIGLFVDELAVLVAGQDVADLADGQPP